MADTFTPLSQSDQTCPQGQGYSLILQRCMSKQDYADAVSAMLAAGKPQQAAELIQEGKTNGAIPETSLIEAILSGRWQSAVQMFLPLIVGLIGLILVFLAVSAWVNAKSITIAGQSLALPKVL